MPRYRVVDPFATKRIGRPAPDGPTPPPETPGELARRMAKAMRARIDAAGADGDTLETLLDPGQQPAEDAGSPAAVESLPPQEAQGELAAADAPVAAEPAVEPGSEPQGPDGDGLGDALAGWLTASEAAEVLQVDPAEVRRRCREGELDAAKDASGAWRINPAALTAP